jgi:diadenosine tetraphosphate (Ap4A) HIT family hydrolase
MTGNRCPFCNPREVLFENELAFAIPDRSPVRPGHTLVIPRRHTASFFDLTDEEVTSCFELIKKVREKLEREHSPGGYKIGVNIGRSSGQTVMHTHIHVVPMGGKGPGRRSEVFSRGDM